MFSFKVWSHWVVLPTSLRRAAAFAVLIVLASSALLYQTNVRAERPPKFTRGGAFARDLTQPGSLNDIGIDAPNASPTPVPTRSSAVLRAPDGSEDLSGSPTGGPQFPVLARYVYAVAGSEQATAFGSRSFPPEMAMTVHRTQPSDSTVPKLKEDEVIFDLDFSSDHEEREIVAYRKTGLLFTYEAGSVTFGPGVTRTSEATYDPPMLQIPLPLSVGTNYKGTSRAIDNSGEVVRIEDWTVEVRGREHVVIEGKSVATWVVHIDRQSRPGTSEQVTRSRTYWFDARRALWVKWEEKLDGSQDVGPGDFSYHTEFTATLTRIEPL